MTFDSTGCFHWCSAREVEECTLTRCLDRDQEDGVHDDDDDDGDDDDGDDDYNQAM